MCKAIIRFNDKACTQTHTHNTVYHIVMGEWAFSFFMIKLNHSPSCEDGVSPGQARGTDPHITDVRTRGENERIQRPNSFAWIAMMQNASFLEKYHLSSVIWMSQQLFVIVELLRKITFPNFIAFPLETKYLWHKKRHEWLTVQELKKREKDSYYLSLPYYAKLTGFPPVYCKTAILPGLNWLPAGIKQQGKYT